MLWLKYIVVNDDIANKFKSNTTNTINVGKLFL